MSTTDDCRTAYGTISEILQNCPLYLGDIRNDVWRDLVRELIVRSHEEDLFDKLLEWEKEHTYWLKTKAELEHYTLELYAARIFDNPKWVDYEAFAKHYGYQPQSYEE